MKKIKKSKLLRLALFVFFAYIGVQLFINYLHIGRSETQYSQIVSSAAVQEATNRQTQRILNTQNESQYAEQVARRQLNYAKPGEQVYIDANN